VTFAGQRVRDHWQLRFLTICSGVDRYPASVTTIRENTFNLCRGLTTVAIAAGSVLQSIGIYAFYLTACSPFLSARGERVESIGRFCFTLTLLLWCLSLFLQA
jgi:hypothetical protein